MTFEFVILVALVTVAVSCTLAGLLHDITEGDRND